MENERRYSGEALHGTMPEANLEMGSGFDERMVFCSVLPLKVTM